MFPYTSSQPQFHYRHVPRRYIQTADLDDYLQLQLLLQQERERRIAEQERRRALEDEYLRRLDEDRRLDEAIARLQFIQQLRQRQRFEEERRLRREQRYRDELLATLKAAEEDESYRRRLLAALERQKQWETARLEREDDLAKKRETLRREDNAKREMLEGLLKHIFGHQEQDDRDNDERIPNLLNDDATVWEKYYRPDPSPRSSPVTRKIPIDDVSSANNNNNNKAQRPELKEHVAPLQNFLQNLLANSSEPEQRKNPDNAGNPSNSHTPSKKPPSSSSSSSCFVPSKEAEKPAPALTQDQAAAKIQTWYKSAHDAQAVAQVTHQLSTLGEISTQLEKVQSDYEQSVLNVQLDSAKGNKRWLQYEDEIMKILVRLDTIESNGSDLIRERRKELVNKATTLLDRLDEHKQSELERSSASSGHGDVDVTIDDAPSEGGALNKPEPYAIPEGQGVSSSDPVIESNAEDVNMASVSEDANMAPVSEDTNMAPVSEDTNMAPVSEDTNMAPVSDDTNMAPISEDVDMAPVSEGVNVVPTEQSKPAHLLSATPGHPHPENPNATTVDDADNEPTPAVEVSDPIADVTPPPPPSSSSSDNAAVGKGEGEDLKPMDEDGFVVV